jgi:hypothetical protein
LSLKRETTIGDELCINTNQNVVRPIKLYLFWDSRDQTIVSVLG